MQVQGADCHEQHCCFARTHQTRNVFERSQDSYPPDPSIFSRRTIVHNADDSRVRGALKRLRNDSFCAVSRSVNNGCLGLGPTRLITRAIPLSPMMMSPAMRGMVSGTTSDCLNMGTATIKTRHHPFSQTSRHPRGLPHRQNRPENRRNHELTNIYESPQFLSPLPKIKAKLPAQLLVCS